MKTEQKHALDSATSQELAKFSKMAHQWWDNKGPCEPLHAINPIRLGFIKHYATLKNIQVADIGCGGGILAESMAAEDANVTAVDLNSDLINVAKLHLLESKLKVNYINDDFVQFSRLHANEFSVVTCMELIEHVSEPESLLKSCTQLLKPSGTLFLSTINRNLLSYFKAILGAEYFLNLLPPGTHEYNKFLKPSEICEFAFELGLDLLALKGFSYNPLTKEYFETDDISVNYMMAFQWN